MAGLLLSSLRSTSRLIALVRTTVGVEYDGNFLHSDCEALQVRETVLVEDGDRGQGGSGQNLNHILGIVQRGLLMEH